MPFCKGTVWIRKKLSPYKRAFFTETLVAKLAKQLSRKKLSCQQKDLQFWYLVVINKRFRKHGLMHKVCGVSKIAYVAGAVAVAGKKNGRLILQTAAQELGVIVPGIPAVSVRGERCFVDLQEHLVFLSAGCHSVIVYGIMWVITMA